ncbi:hypothetical protein SAMN02910353_02436 [Ruminococcus sp. YRD2003]|uniref:Nmad2 family putative nucleotide modification protein n=1 Tax=Ruminococcus sp. YRD2003 TaxID=1452313 RepID=UPI0008D3998B|nr:hypothetical protein SAMN02910353_02436 [Ruminococcus flavefaciens]
MTYLYIYRLTSDTGLAPCVEDGLLSLACCKGGQIRNGKPIHTGLRYRVGAMRDGADHKTDDIYLLGTYKNKFLYLARITNIVTMYEYFSRMSKNRTDSIYSLDDGKLVRNHHLWNEGVHVDEKQNIRDIAGEYVLLSDDFTYLGKDAVFDELVDKYNAKFRETKLYKGEVAELIVAECQKYRDGKKHLPTNPLKKKCGGC